jgi:transcriptional regulator BetI-like protein
LRVERNTKRRSVRHTSVTSKRKKRRSPQEAAPAPLPPTVILEERALPIVSALDRVAKGTGRPRLKLEGAMEILFGAYGESDFEFSGLFLTGWMRAREDKQFRLTLAWQREQARLSVQDILAEGVASGDFRRDLDPGATAAVILGTAEGCLLQSATDGGAVTAEQLMRTLLTLIVSGA